MTDRRHFSSEGEARDEPEPRADPAPEPPAQEATPRLRPGAPPDRPPDFREFLLGLFAQASVLLAGGPKDEPRPDPEGARYLISILEMLKDKTDGRRTADEEQVLEGILYELRMAYLAQTRVSGA